MTLVVFDVVAASRRAGHDRATPLSNEDRRSEGGAAWVFKDDVDVVAHEATDVLSQPTPFRFVLGVFIGPELVVLGTTINYGLHAQFIQQRNLRLRRDDANRSPASIEHVLAGIRSKAPRGTPNENLVALLHIGAILRDKHSIRG